MKTPESFDVDAMVDMLTSQGGPFKGGQRINDEVAALLNGLPEALYAIRFYQETNGVAEYTRFVPVAPEAVVAPHWRDGMPAKEVAPEPKRRAWRKNLKQADPAEAVTASESEATKILGGFTKE